MRISDWISDVCSSDLFAASHSRHHSWHKITATPFTLSLLLDFTPTAVRILLGEDNSQSAETFELRVSMSMGEFYMAMCVWRSDERRVGKECVSAGRSGWSP